MTTSEEQNLIARDDSANEAAETPSNIVQSDTEQTPAAEVEAEPAVEAEPVQADTTETTEESTTSTEATDEAPTQQQEEAATEPEAQQEEEAAAEEYVMPTFTAKEEVIDYLSMLVSTNVTPERIELDKLKQIYYKLQTTLAQEALAAFIAGGGEEADFLPPVDATETRFKDLHNTLRSRRKTSIEEEERLKAENLRRKTAIIERIKELSETAETADKGFDEVKALQAEWREIKAVPAESSAELWKSYQFNVEKYYDQIKLNRECRDYDFRKNLELKTALCEEAEKLAESSDIIAAFNRLQELHNEYRETGPVEKELRERLWGRFKAASTTINKLHQDYFLEQKAKQEENIRLKTELCEKVEAIAIDGITRNSEWDKLTDEVKELQTQWKAIGYTNKKVNTKLYERFRAGCDRIFTAKSEHYSKQRNELNENLARKQELLRQAEELRESTDWATTANKLMDLQKEWKTIGSVPRKVSDTIWKKFHEACNYFFERKEQETGGQRREETANLEMKKDVISELTLILEEKAEDATERVQALMARWREIGFVPFKQKDKINKAYKQVIDRLYDELDLRRARRNFESFTKNIAGKAASEIDHQRDRLYRAYEAKKNEIKTFETNLTFLTTKSKSGNTLLDEMARNMEKLKRELEQIREKIEAIDAHKNEEKQEAKEEKKEETPTSAAE